MAKRKGKVAEVSREEMNEVAEELNDVIGFEQPIKFGKRISNDVLKEAITTECMEVYTTDFVENEDGECLSEETADVLSRMDITITEPSEDEDDFWEVGENG